MKNLSILLFISALILSCDEREKYITALNSKPTLVFGLLDNGVATLSDSMKVGLKTGQKFYEIVLKVGDLNNNITKATYAWVGGEGSIYQDGVLVTGTDFILPKEGQINLRIIPKSLGKNRITFSITDSFNETADANLDLTAFNNLTPVAQFTLTPVGLLDPLEYEINATKSFDRDAKYGGTIERYFFYVNDIEIGATLGSNPKLKWIFAEKKQYKITVKVQDGDGAYGELIRNEQIR